MACLLRKPRDVGRGVCLESAGRLHPQEEHVLSHHEKPAAKKPAAKKPAAKKPAAKKK